MKLPPDKVIKLAYAMLGLEGFCSCLGLDLKMIDQNVPHVESANITAQQLLTALKLVYPNNEVQFLDYGPSSRNKGKTFRFDFSTLDY